MTRPPEKYSKSACTVMKVYYITLVAIAMFNFCRSNILEISWEQISNTSEITQQPLERGKRLRTSMNVAGSVLKLLEEGLYLQRISTGNDASGSGCG